MSFSNCLCWVQRASAQPTGKHPRLVLSAAHQEWNHVVIGLLGMDKGFFEAEGLDNVTVVNFPDDEEAQLEALASGRVDIALDPATHKVLAAQDRGADMYIIAPRRKSHAFVIVGQKGMRSLADLKGKTIDMIPDAEPTQQIRQLLKMNGLEWERDVKINYVKDLALHDLLELEKRFLAGQDPITVAHPWDAHEWAEKGYPLLADSSKVFPPRQDRVVAANGRLVRERPDTVTAFMKAYILANRFVIDPDNGDEVRASLEKGGFIGSEEEKANWPIVIGHVRRRMSSDAHLPTDGLEQVLAEQRESGNISTRLTLEQVVRLEPADQARQELGLQAVEA